MSIEVTVNDDYMIADTPNGFFYYGYEVTKCNVCGEIGGTSCEKEDHDNSEWCFEVKIGGTRTVIPFSDLGQDDQFAIEPCFVAGMIIYFTA